MHFSFGAFLLIYIRATRAGLLEAGGAPPGGIATSGAAFLGWIVRGVQRSGVAAGAPRPVAQLGGAFLLGAHRSGAGRLTSTCAGPRTCADVQSRRRVQVCRASDVCRCAEMCRPVRLNIRRRVTACVTNVWTCANMQGLGRVQMCGTRAEVRSSPQMREFRHIVATSTTKVYEKTNNSGVCRCFANGDCSYIDQFVVSC